MRRETVFVVATALVVSSLFVPSEVAGSEGGWPLEDPARTLVAFGECYQGPDGTVATHRGIDLAAAPGSSVLCVLPGTVTFAGRVPAGEGATTLAVTVESGDLRLTYMPLAEVEVVSGESLSAEARIGSLAATGDRSHPEPHLHLSVRRGTLYIDPEPFLIPPPSTKVETEANGVPAAGGGTVAPSSPAPSPASGVSPVPVASSMGSATSAQGASTVGEVRSTASQATSTQVTEGATAGQPHQVSDAVHSDTARPGAITGEPAHGPSRVRQTSDAMLNQVGLDPERTRTALVENRREKALSGAPVSHVFVLAGAGVVALALLWPVWRAVPLVATRVGPVGEDVAAVLAR